MKAAFVRFDRLSEDLATGRHNWKEHKLALVLLAKAPDKGADSVSGVHSLPLSHSVQRSGRTTALTISNAMLRAEGAAIGPYAAVAVVNATTNAPIAYGDLGAARTLEDGASTEFRFPSDLVYVTS